MWRKFGCFIAIVLGFFLVVNSEGQVNTIVGHENARHTLQLFLLCFPFLALGIALVVGGLDLIGYSRLDVIPTAIGGVLTLSMLMDSFTSVASNHPHAYDGVSLAAFACGSLAFICFSITFIRSPAVEWRMLAFLLSLLPLMGILMSLHTLGYLLGLSKS